ncbi:MAG TPA: metal-dependent transcriptional regulator [Planctomycetota bacterium]|nr:metal-dependent transcriptional regulator [Planctomycetota bacterium]
MTERKHSWKEFNENPVSHSMAHYLVKLRDLNLAHGYARVSDVARELDVTKGTVSVQMRHLKEKGFVSEDSNRMLRLTESGETLARQVIYNRATIIQFLNKVLEVDAEQAEVDACKIEHLLSPETGHQMLALVQLLLSDEPAAKALLRSLKRAREGRREEAAGAAPRREQPGVRPATGRVARGVASGGKGSGKT